MDDRKLAETILEQSGVAPCVVIDDNCNVLYIHGRTGKFLEPPEGRASVNILEMARGDVREKLTSAIRQVADKKQEVVCRGLHVPQSSGECYVDLTVRPILDAAQTAGLMIVVFDETSSPSKQKKAANKTAKPKKGKSLNVGALELELQQAKEYLQATIEELETTNEEHKSTNEELQSTNEELQSTNEELETSKEELQSLNEESATVNAELQARVDELSKSNDDIKNLLDSTAVATLFLDLQLNISRFTPVAKKVIPLTATDIGRPIGDLSTTLIDADLTKIGTQVLDDLMMREIVLQSDDGQAYLLRARPYRTLSNLIDGVVLTFEDITERKRTEDALRDSEQRFRTLFELGNDSIALVDVDKLCFAEANQRAYETLGYTQREFSKLKISDIDASLSIDEIEKKVQQIVDEGAAQFQSTHRTKAGKTFDVRISAQSLSLNGRGFLLCTWQYISQT